MDTIPETLYHYCDARGFLSIIQNKCLWLSHAYYMNDYMEHKWLVEKADEYLVKLATQDDHCFIQMLNEPLKRVSFPFITCFSKESDSLSQWRAYADDGRGFAIGFSTERIRQRLEEVAEEGCDCVLKEVIYGELEQLAAIQSIVDSAVEEMTSLSPGADLQRMQSIAALKKNDLWRLATWCKNHGFAEEKEWRIALLPHLYLGDDGIESDFNESRIDFRVNGAGEIVPFFEFSFDADDVVEIWRGPRNHSREGVSSLDLLLIAKGYSVNSIEVNKSEATYR